MLKYGSCGVGSADPTKVGLYVRRWDLVPETMPAAATTVTAQWANATQASYQVVYWGENLTGGYDYLYADKATGAVGGNIPYSTSLTASHMPQAWKRPGLSSTAPNLREMWKSPQTAARSRMFISAARRLRFRSIGKVGLDGLILSTNGSRIPACASRRSTARMFLPAGKLHVRMTAGVPIKMIIYSIR